MPKIAFFKNKHKLNLSENCNVVVPISVGQPYHEAEEFQATIQFIKKDLAVKVTFVIADVLQRFTKALECNQPPDTLRECTHEEGKQWLSRNKADLLSLDNKLKNIIFWDAYLKAEDFNEKKLLVDNLYRDDETFKKAVDGSVKIFLRRYFKSQREYNPESMEHYYSREYILEECAVLLLWALEKHNLIIYPKKLNQAMYNLLQRLVYRDYPELLKVAEITFSESISNIPCKKGNAIDVEAEAQYLLSAIKNYASQANLPYAIRKNFVFSLSAFVGDARKSLQQEKNLQIEIYKSPNMRA
jgi:tRNA-dependent cyclodipeptide synthase